MDHAWPEHNSHFIRDRTSSEEESGEEAASEQPMDFGVAVCFA